MDNLALYSRIVDEKFRKMVDILYERKIKLSSAESCTGGLFAAYVTSIPGSSTIFDFGGVTYSNEMKHKLLGVKNETLDKYGAVSKETAYEMAEGIKEYSGSDIAVSITGIAGPTGDTPGKPIGLVYVGINLNNNIQTYKLLNLNNKKLLELMGNDKHLQRDYIRLFTIDFCVDKIIEWLC